MTTEQPLLNLDFEEPKIIVTNSDTEQEALNTARNHLVVVDQHINQTSTFLLDDVNLKNDENLLEEEENKIDILSDDKNSVISLSSSTTEDISLVPEVIFDSCGTLDSGGDNRESQPLLGGRDHVDMPANHFPGNYIHNKYIFL